MRSSMCVSKSGLTLHRMSRHGYQPIRAHTSQRDECEETALHLLSCPALHPLRVRFAIVDDIPLKKLCFSKLLAKFLIAVERNYAMPESSQPRNPTQPTSPPL
ncbi:Tbingi protein [Trypanosoma theileri]|uniref:Tbingi protein n=1 Tax=Trypanosoma theileri TaxID=67003 RepID=A0A1X0NFP8_9TRYP|nr:Tbingi protein [Trypanosoma theileri]ORC83552.1 Tbingi protein [Trypanosoma theileri]